MSERAQTAPEGARRVFIGVAWPYANGPLHLGHVAGSLLPPDIFARFHRMSGHDVLMVSGSDEHGTPITVSAEKEGVTPQELVDRYHAQHTAVLDALGISFDLFTRTSTDHHREWVHDVFRGLQDEGYIEQRVMTQPYDPKAGRFLPDRYVEGECPNCGYAEARGDQCDECGRTLDAADLIEPRSRMNPETPIEFRETTHAFFTLSEFEDRLRDWFNDGTHPWRANVERFTQNWLDEGLHDRAVTRDIDWGIPWIDDDPTFEDKRIYVWFEAFCGYYTAAGAWARDVAGDPDAYKRFWQVGHDDADVRHYYFLAKDNIPFHTILWPGIILGYSDALESRGEPRLHLPYDVPANEYLNLSGRQFSKSRGVGIWVHEVLDQFEPDAVRYYLAINMPENRDTDWVWDDFVTKVNTELVGQYGNFVHRTLTMAAKHFEAVPPPADTDELDAALDEELRTAHAEVSELLDACRFKDALKRVMALARAGNKYIDDRKPWALIKEDRDACGHALHQAARLCRSLAILSAPFLPHAAERLWSTLGQPGSVHDAGWDAALDDLEPGAALADVQPLFTKLDADEVAAIAGTGDGSENASATDTEPEEDSNLISFDDFQKLELRTATITSVEDHPDADKLYVLTLDAGGEDRQVVAGLKGLVAKDDLEGRTVVFVANLEPAKLRGVESQGMILAAEDADGNVVPIGPLGEIGPGAKVR